MDFTEAFRHSSVGCIAFSPGSTFLAYVSGSQPRTLLVRASSTLQVIRSWDFVTDIDSIEWSSDGSFVLLTSNSTQRNHEGVAYVVSLDPGREANDGSDENQGWVARIASGSEGLVGSTWTPPVGPRSVVLFSQHQLRASLYSLPDQTISAIEGPKRSNLIWSPKRPSNFALILKGEDRDYLHVFSCARVTADMLRESAYVLRSEEQWQFERSFPLASNDAADALWSPDGLHIAVWEGQLEYKLLVYTPLGKLRSTFMIDPVLEGEPTTVAPHLDSTSTARPPKPSAALSQSVLRGSATAAGSFGANNSGSSGSSSNNNSPHAGHSTKSKNASDMVSAVAGGGLGIRQVQWHPSGKYIAVGGYDEQVRILESSEWLECASLDLAKRTIGAPPASVVSSVYGPLKAWREPTNWFEETRARGIVTFEPASLPIAPAALRVDTGKASPKLGVSWMQWSPDGSLIASFNERLPFTIFVHFFQDVVESTAPQPYLLSVLQLSMPFHKAEWKPGHAGKLAIVCENQAIYTWELLDPPTGEASFGQRAEAVPIPIDDLRATDVSWAPDGRKVLIASDDSFCCAFDATDAAVDQVVTSRDASRDDISR